MFYFYWLLNVTPDPKSGRYISHKLVLLYKQLGQTTPSFSLVFIKMQEPSQCSSSQAMLEAVDHQLLISVVGGHTSCIHGEVDHRVRSPFKLLEVRHFELWWDFH